jgi:tetratricopeptide (TPR) repeat protein
MKFFRFITTLTGALFYNSLIFSQIDTLFFKAKAFEHEKLYDSSLIYYSKTPEKKDNVLSLLLGKANSLYQLTMYNEAINDFKKADKIEADAGTFGLARCYAHMGDKNKAIEYLQKHLSSKYRLPEPEVKLDKAFIWLSNTSEWKNLWSKDWYSRYEDQVRDAESLLKNKDYLGVIEFVNNNVKSSSHKHELIAIRAKAYYESGSYNMAVNDYSVAIKIFRKNKFYFFERAINYDKLQDYKESSDDYTMALKLDPYYFEAYSLRAEALRKLGRFTDAQNDIEFYLWLFPGDKNALFEAGLITYDAKSYVSALKYFNKLMKIDSTNVLCIEKRGNVYESLKMYVYAEKDYSNALMLHPDNVELLYRRGVIRYAMNNKSDACVDWKKAMKMGHFMASECIQRYCK